MLCVSQAVDLAVDESSFTGETTPSHKHTQQQSAAHSDISQLCNVAFMGTFVCSGHGKVAWMRYYNVFCVYEYRGTVSVCHLL